MPWGRCDDGFYDHQKVMDMPRSIRNAAAGLFWRGISRCNRQLSDGRLTVSDLEVIDAAPQEVDALVAVKLWHRSGKGFRIHDFAEFNETRAEVIAKREKKAAAGALGGLRSGESRRAKHNRTAGEAGASRLVEPPSRPVEKKNVSLGRTKPGMARVASVVGSIPTNGLLPPEDEQLIERAQAIWNDTSNSDDLRLLARDRLENLGVKV